MKCFYFVMPSAHLSVEGQIGECIRSIDKILSDEGNRVLKVAFFIDAHNKEDLFDLKNLIACKMNEGFNIPYPYSVIAQPPINCKIAAEICYVDLSNKSHIKIDYKSHKDFNYSLLTIGDVKEVISSGITFYDGSLPIYHQMLKCFNIMEEILQIEGMDLSSIVRQWNYIEDIVGEKVLDGKTMQNYQQLNDVRELFYRKYNFINGYPSATGIGMNTGGAIFEFIASSQRDGIISITNLEQVEAYKYSQRILVGEAISQLNVKATPKFERAKLVTANEAKELYISGTAAIKGEETLAIGDVVKQLDIIVDNINKLIDEENLKKQGIIIKGAMEYSSLRIYIKDRAYAEEIETAISKYYPCVKALIVVADVCRRDLLIEIEGMCRIRD